MELILVPYHILFNMELLLVLDYTFVKELLLVPVHISFNIELLLVLDCTFVEKLLLVPVHISFIWNYFWSLTVLF